MKGAAVSFKQVAKQYGATNVLVDFTLDIAPGEFVTLLGASGSGKSTALNILAGFIDTSSGQVTVDGRNVLTDPPEARNIGMVFQNYSLFPHMDVFENVAFPLRLRKVSRADVRRRVTDVLEMVQLAGYESRKPNELSGGQRQRVAFARAVVFEPAVLLMDEPLGALDLKLREAMQSEIKRYHRQLGCTIIFVTHDQNEALALSDRIAVMGHARVAQIGTPQQIYDQPTSRFVAEFIGKTNVLALTSDGDGGVELPGLGAQFQIRHQASPHDARFVSLRPERLRRSELGSDGLVTFEAQVIEVTFLGDNVNYIVRATGGAELMFRESRGHHIDSLTNGDWIRLGFDSREATMLPEDVLPTTA